VLPEKVSGNTLLLSEGGGVEYLLPYWLKIALCAVLCIRMFVSGFVTKLGLFAWPMFSEMSMTSIQIIVGEKSINPWHHLIDGDIGMTRQGLVSFLEYLTSLGIKADGHATIYDSEGIEEVAIADSSLI
jgi:hypothetical protein